MGLSAEDVSLLRPYLEGDRPGEDGEWGMHCPLHEDKKRSGSVNVNSRKWFCHSCLEGGPINGLLYRLYLAREADGGAASETPFEFAPVASAAPADLPAISEGMVMGWCARLFDNQEAIDWFLNNRGLQQETLAKYQIGLHDQRRVFTIPIRSATGGILNVRHYNPTPPAGRRKIWSLKGRGSPTLYPISTLDDSTEVIICEGEWDALLTIQMGFPAITQTGGAGKWKNSWNHWFEDKVVWVCHDMDTQGQEANEKVARALEGVAREVRIIHLPFPVTEKSGKDLTDFWLDGAKPADFKDLMGEGDVRRREERPEDFVDVGVLDSFNSDASGKKLRLKVTITGKRNPPFLIPMVVDYRCQQDQGPKCNSCPMNDLGGEGRRHIPSHDSRVLEMMSVPTRTVDDILRQVIGAPKCASLRSTVSEFRSVEELYARPSVDRRSTGQAGDYTSRKIISVGRHDSMPNSTVEVVGTIYPNPKLQHNELQAWEVSKTETSIDRYTVTPEGVKMMQAFQAPPKVRPLRQLGNIVRVMGAGVTKILGRNEMHAIMDLVFHSALSFHFAGELIPRGWIECLVVGDTRTGKSEAAEKLIRHYGVGEMISCESATFAGIVGGLTQYGSGREWEITWGAVPLNDRRLVVLDEVSGMLPEQIAQMSSIRSSGEAQLTKIRSERTFARTRLIWLGNPRSGRMSDYTYGVQAIRPLIGNNEDIARFDIAMTVMADEVDPAVINRYQGVQGFGCYTPEACNELVTWCWSRRADQVVWEPGVEQTVFDLALEIGGRYVEVPPLIQAANARIKISRLAVAMAARLFSTDDTYENIVVKRAHVEDTVRFLDLVYGMPKFGYKDISDEARQDEQEARDLRDEAKGFLVSNRGLAKFLRSMGRFRSNDMQDMLNLTREDANALIGSLWRMRMISREGANIKVQPVLHELLREVSE